MRLSSVRAVLAALLVPLVPCAAQAPSEVGAKRLDTALAKMAGLGSLRFATTEDAVAGQVPFGAGVGEKVAIAGVAGGGLMQARWGDHEFVFAADRMVARERDGAHELRHERCADGTPLPFVLRPAAFFAGLRQMGLEVARIEPGTLDDRPVEVVSVTVTGEQAYDLVYAGLAPGVRSAANVIIMRAGGKPVEPELTLDLAFFIDPATQLVQAVKLRGYAKGAAMAGGAGGMMVFAAGGGAQFRVARARDEKAQEEEKPAEEPAAKAGAAPAYENGFPVREQDDETVAFRFEAVFTEHGTAPVPELPERARALLGLTR